MNDHTDRWRELLEQCRTGDVSVDDALAELRHLPYEDLGFARLDHHRAFRRGFPEVIFCQGKTPDHSARIAQALAARSNRVLATRANAETAAAIRAVLPHAVYHPLGRIVTITQGPIPEPAPDQPLVLVVAAGTSDLPVAEEAVLTARIMGSRVEQLTDVGVAGLHRILAVRDKLEEARVIIVVAGMEGALTTVVGGLVSCPVIAVPTSVGYGASFGGLAALLAMLNSCVPGVTVVNIDNGFGAAYAAHLIANGDRK
ncbi:MAG: nickel pincer cofactor biosynthesis protein LarB [Chloroflexi bacterium]|nr:nickel pincer cofactor biosynthesis protein LarB [Chloroflexota bacterium]